MQDVEEYKFTETLLKRERSRVANCEKEHDSTSKQVKFLTNELDVLNFEASQNKVWIASLLHQFQFMSNGASLACTPLLIENPRVMPLDYFIILIVTTCPICKLFYSYNNISATSCGCTYHPFCLGDYLETKATHCAKPICGKILLTNWIISFGFKQYNVKLTRPKLEKGECGRSIWIK